VNSSVLEAATTICEHAAFSPTLRIATSKNSCSVQLDHELASSVPKMRSVYNAVTGFLASLWEREGSSVEVIYLQDSDQPQKWIIRDLRQKYASGYLLRWVSQALTVLALSG
jgi:hypothetical protein